MKEAAIPANTAQKAEVIPNIENGVAATASAIKAPNRNLPLKPASKALCSDDRIAKPARVMTKVRGNTVISDVNVPAPSAMNTVNAAAIRLAQ
jgi:hypothetical protein